MEHAEQNDRRDDGSDEVRDQRARGTTRRADDSHQRHVTESHRGSLQPQFSEPPYDRDPAAASAHAENRIPGPGERRRIPEIDRAEGGDCAGEQRGDGHEEDAEARESVWNEKMLRVRYSDSEQDRRKNRHAKRCECRPELQVRGEPEQSDQQLHDWILNRDALSAGAAASTQHEPAHDRNVLARRDLMPAIRTSGPRLHNRETFRPAANANIEKRSEDRSKEKDEYAGKDFNHVRSS